MGHVPPLERMTSVGHCVGEGGGPGEADLAAADADLDDAGLGAPVLVLVSTRQLDYRS